MIIINTYIEYQIILTSKKRRKKKRILLGIRQTLSLPSEQASFLNDAKLVCISYRPSSNGEPSPKVNEPFKKILFLCI